MIYSLEKREVQLIGGPHFIASNATLVGSVVVRPNANIWFNVVIRADNDVIEIGENSNIQDGSVLHTDSGIPLTIGQGVTVGDKAMPHAGTTGDYSVLRMNAVASKGANS